MVLFGCIVASIIASLAGLWVYIYYMKKGQFDDPEEVKYQLFREDQPGD